MITEGALGRIFEVTAEKEIVWEYINPYYATDPNRTNRIFRAHRVPYDWVPQLERPARPLSSPRPTRSFALHRRDDCVVSMLS